MASGTFTEGKILQPLLKFAIPVIMALFLQSLYGAVDLLIVGHYATSADVSAVSTGAQILSTVTNVIAGLSMGTTILLGQLLGEGKPREAGKAVGASIVFFILVAAALSVLMLLNIERVASIMNAPAEAFEGTCSYLTICSAGLFFITAYNLLGSLFRGLGNSRIPLLSVAVAAVINIFGDIFAVKYLGLGSAGAAYATVISQGFSVIFSLIIITKIKLPFEFKKSDIRFKGSIIRRVVNFGFPLALSDLLVGLSFLVILAIVNSLGVTVSAGVGVAGKVTGFIMLIPAAFGQSMASFVSQNYGAGKMDRANKCLAYGIGVSLACGLFMAWLSFFNGGVLCEIFSSDSEVVYMGWEYMKAYSFDCILTSFFFCLTGYFNGCGYTKFVMAQGMIGAFLVRIPVSWIMSRQVPVSLFKIGLATPCSSLVQTILCVSYYFIVRKKLMAESANAVTKA